VASGIAEKLDLRGIFMHTVPGLVFGLIFCIAWRWEVVGGALLAAALPPLIAGIMLIRHWWAGRSGTA
jgi:hypothetical protein